MIDLMKPTKHSRVFFGVLRTMAHADKLWATTHDYAKYPTKNGNGELVFAAISTETLKSISREVIGLREDLNALLRLFSKSKSKESKNEK